MIRDVTSCTYVGTVPSKQKPKGFVAWLMKLDAHYRQRSALAAMPDEQLRDIGLDRKDVSEAMDAPFWDPPIQLR